MDDSSSEDEIRKPRKRKALVVASESENSGDDNLDAKSVRRSTRISNRTEPNQNISLDTKATPNRCKTKNKNITKCKKSRRMYYSGTESDECNNGAVSSNSNDKMNLVTPSRKSLRLKQKDDRSIKTPSRKARLESMCERSEHSSSSDEYETYITVKRTSQSLSNNFIYE